MENEKEDMISSFVINAKENGHMLFQTGFDFYRHTEHISTPIMFCVKPNSISSLKEKIRYFIRVCCHLKTNCAMLMYPTDYQGVELFYRGLHSFTFCYNRTDIPIFSLEPIIDEELEETIYYLDERNHADFKTKEYMCDETTLFHSREGSVKTMMSLLKQTINQYE